MIVRRTKIQLMIFALVTVLGGTFVGGRYAQLDRLVLDRTYTVTAHFSDAGGIFAGAPVSYRGIEVGAVERLTPEPGGVRVDLDIENGAPRIPADLRAFVANKSAIGEQYVDLRPRVASGPYLAEGAVISKDRTSIPVSSADLLVDVNSLVKSLDTESLRTVVDELGQAFQGTGPDLARILDTTSSFIRTADDNIAVTRSLIRDSDSVLQTQIDKRGAVGEFSENLAKLSDTLVDADPDLRRLLDKGSDAAGTLDDVVGENADQLGSIVGDLRTANAPLLTNLAGLQSIFLLYPYLLSGTYSVMTPAGDAWNAAFGLVLTDPTSTCTYASSGGESSGYLKRRADATVSDREFATDIDCKVTPNNIARQPAKSQFNRVAAGADGSWANLLLDPVSR